MNGRETIHQIAAQSGIRRHRSAEGDAEVGLFHIAVLDGCKEQFFGLRGLGNDDKAAGACLTCRAVPQSDITITLRDPVSRRGEAEIHGFSAVSQTEPQLAVICDLAHGPYRKRAGVTGLPPGTYRATFVDPNGGHAQEYFDNAPDFSGATPFNITAAADTNIDGAITVP